MVPRDQEDGARRNQLKFRLRIPIEVALEEALPSIGDIIHSVNDTMEGFGFSEKLTLRSTLFHFEVTIERKPTTEECEKLAGILQSFFEQRLPQLKPMVGGISDWSCEVVLASVEEPTHLPSSSSDQ